MDARLEGGAREHHRLLLKVVLTRMVVLPISYHVNMLMIITDTKPDFLLVDRTTTVPPDERMEDIFHEI